MSRPLNVFLVEDNASLREETIFSLTALGFTVSGFGDAAGLFRALAVQDCDIVVIDVGLPDEDGFSIAAHLRANKALGLVFLTARAMIEDRVHGLELGADAYLVKPVDVRELAATLHAVGRRLRARDEAAAAPAVAVAEERPAEPRAWTLCADGWVLRNPRGRELAVTEAERRFLDIMVGAAGCIVPREKLIDAFAGDDPDYDPHRLDAIISRLRKRAEQAGLGKLPLKAIRGTGYVFTA